MEKIFSIPEGHSTSMVIMSGAGGRRLLSCSGTARPAMDAEDFDSVVLEKDSVLNLVYIVMPGAGADIRLTADLNGEGAGLTVSGIYLCDGEDRLPVMMDVRHNVPHCSSRQLFKGLVSGKSKADFYGKITVAPDAQKTEAYQENHTIILSDDARVGTKPQLEIYADDVKCSHGATVGRLNEEEQFYMRSRGIPEDEAKVLQMLSFLAPVLDFIDDSHLREDITARVDSAARDLVRLTSMSRW